LGRTRLGRRKAGRGDGALFLYKLCMGNGWESLCKLCFLRLPISPWTGQSVPTSHGSRRRRAILRTAINLRRGPSTRSKTMEMTGKQRQQVLCISNSSMELTPPNRKRTTAESSRKQYTNSMPDSFSLCIYSFTPLTSFHIFSHSFPHLRSDFSNSN
jgi:hypothetical protein